MLEKMKAKIIHLLGGSTEKDVCNFLRAKYYAGKCDAYLEMLSEMWRNRDKTADDRCIRMYDFAEAQHFDNTFRANEFNIRHENKRTSTDS